MINGTMERRRSTRVDCELPLTILKVGTCAEDRSEKTRNISSNGGVCFQSSRQIALGQLVEYEITLSTMRPEVKLICSGRVVRCQPVRNTENEGEYEIALTMLHYVFSRSGVEILGERAHPRTHPLPAVRGVE